MSVSTASREILFEVLDNDGKRYVIYTNGDVEGFGDDPYIINHYRALLAKRIAEWNHTASKLLCPKT